MTPIKPATALVLAICCNWAQAQEEAATPPPDISDATLALISAELGCKDPQQANAAAGCDILKKFSSASRPDPAIFQRDGGLDGQRWLGTSVISDKSSKPKFAFNSSTPFQGMIVLAARHSSNFHQKNYFANGVGFIYFWPENARQAAMIEDAHRALRVGPVDAESRPATYAKSYKLDFSPARQSSGTSLVIGQTTKVRQQGPNLYIVGIDDSDETIPVYYLSHVRADLPLR